MSNVDAIVTTHGEAMKILCPQHPNRTGKLVLRSGSDKRGNLLYFQADSSHAPPESWTIFRRMTGEEEKAFLDLHASKVLDDRQGPARMVLHYHINERNVLSLQ
jgi:hypothetical protein